MRKAFSNRNGEMIPCLVEIRQLGAKAIKSINDFFLDHEIIKWELIREQNGNPLMVIEYVPTDKERKSALGVEKVTN